MSKQFGKYYKYNINIFCIEIINFVFRPHNVYYSTTYRDCNMKRIGDPLNDYYNFFLA